jgi:hypothetical protein
VGADGGDDPEVGFGNSDLLEEFLDCFEVFKCRGVAFAEGFGGLVMKFAVD